MASMARLFRPLKDWMEENGYGRDYGRLAEQLPSRPTAESMRQVVNGYRPASWDLAFELEAVTGISAHELRLIGAA
jgi:hypothetical protein